MEDSMLEAQQPQQGSSSATSCPAMEEASPSDGGGDSAPGAVDRGKKRSANVRDEAGGAKIKPEFLDLHHKPRAAEFLPPEAMKEVQEKVDQDLQRESGEPPAKKIKLKGRNKKRPVEMRPKDMDRLCPAVVVDKPCTWGAKCKFSHDVAAFLASKPADLGDKCFVFDTFGKCPFGLACRFGGQHIQEQKNVINEELCKKWENRKVVLNILQKDIKIMLWKKRYDFSKADKAWKALKEGADWKDVRERIFISNIDEDSIDEPEGDCKEGNNSEKVAPTISGSLQENISGDLKQDLEKAETPSDMQADVSEKCSEQASLAANLDESVASDQVNGSAASVERKDKSPIAEHSEKEETYNTSENITLSIKTEQNAKTSEDEKPMDTMVSESDEIKDVEMDKENAEEEKDACTMGEKLEEEKSKALVAAGAAGAGMSPEAMQAAMAANPELAKAHMMHALKSHLDDFITRMVMMNDDEYEEHYKGHRKPGKAIALLDADKTKAKKKKVPTATLR